MQYLHTSGVGTLWILVAVAKFVSTEAYDTLTRTVCTWTKPLRECWVQNGRGRERDC